MVESVPAEIGGSATPPVLDFRRAMRRSGSKEPVVGLRFVAREEATTPDAVGNFDNAVVGGFTQRNSYL